MGTSSSYHSRTKGTAMASNWRLTKKEVAHIAYAFEQLKGKKLPGDVYGFESFSESEINSIHERFSTAANANKPSGDYKQERKGR